jgi:hypothetical protein
MVAVADRYLWHATVFYCRCVTAVGGGWGSSELCRIQVRAGGEGDVAMIIGSIKAGDPTLVTQVAKGVFESHVMRSLECFIDVDKA